MQWSFRWIKLHDYSLQPTTGPKPFVLRNRCKTVPFSRTLQTCSVDFLTSRKMLTPRTQFVLNFLRNSLPVKKVTRKKSVMKSCHQSNRITMQNLHTFEKLSGNFQKNSFLKVSRISEINVFSRVPSFPIYTTITILKTDSIAYVSCECFQNCQESICGGITFQCSKFPHTTALLKTITCIDMF